MPETGKWNTVPTGDGGDCNWRDVFRGHRFAYSAARLAVVHPLPEETKHFTDRLEPILENLCKHLTPVEDKDDRPTGMLLDGCINGRKQVAHRNELIWGDFFRMEALYCLEKKGLAS